MNQIRGIWKDGLVTFGLTPREMRDFLETTTAKTVPVFDSYGNPVPSIWVEHLRTMGAAEASGKNQSGM
jgi:hypothetical protein